MHKRFASCTDRIRWCLLNGDLCNERCYENSIIKTPDNHFYHNYMFFSFSFCFSLFEYSIALYMLCTIHCCRKKNSFLHVYFSHQFNSCITIKFMILLKLVTYDLFVFVLMVLFVSYWLLHLNFLKTITFIDKQSANKKNIYQICNPLSWTAKHFPFSISGNQEGRRRDQ